jgi:hypothetical protein
MKTGTIPHHDDSNTILVGNNAQSVLARVDIAQHIKDDVLLCSVLKLYTDHYQQFINLPYLLPFRQVHCGCCKWSLDDPYSSVRVAVVSPTHDFRAYFMISDSPIPPAVPAHLYRSINWQNTPYDGIGSAFIIHPGWTSIWCGVWPRYVSALMFRPEYTQWNTLLATRHIDNIECKQLLVNMYYKG